MNNMMNNNYFNQNTMGNPNFPTQSGIAVNNVQAAKSTSSTPEEMEIIKSKLGNKFSFDMNDSAVAGWDFREGTNLCIEILDSVTDLVRTKYTNEEFNIVMVEDNMVEELLKTLKNVVYTTKLLNTSMDKDVSKQIYIAFGILDKLLVPAYSNGKKNYSSVMGQCKNNVSASGYQGNFGQQQFMFNGQFGAAPNYYVNDNGYNPNMMMNNDYGYPNNFNQMIQQAAMQGAQAAMQQMGNPTAPVGGTMMNGNPFVQNGQAQQTPNMNNGVPFPGQPQQQYQPQPPQNNNNNNNGTPFNPPIGIPVQTAKI